MNAPNLQPLKQFQTRLTGVGDNYVGLNPDTSQVEQKTGSAIGRWFARNFVTRSVADANRRTIDAFLAKLRETPGVSTSFAEAVKGRLANDYRDGKPLSGRTAAVILDETMTHIQEGYVRRSTVELNVREMVARTTAGDLIDSMAGDLVKEFAVTKDELASWQPGIQEAVRTTLMAKAEASGKTPTAADLKQAIAAALLRSVADAWGPGLFDEAQKTLESGVYNRDKLMSCLRDEIANYVVFARATAKVSGAEPDLKAGLANECAQLVRRQFLGSFRPLLFESIPVPVEDDSQFRTVVNDRIHQRDPGITVSSNTLKELSSKINERTRDHFMDKQPMGVPPTSQEIDAKRDALLDEYFSRIDAYTQRPGLSDAERSSARTVMLRMMSPLKPRYYDAVESMQKIGVKLFADLAVAGTQEEVRVLLEKYAEAQNTLIAGLPEDAGPDDYYAIIDLGLGAALEGVDAPALLGKLAKPGSDYFVSAHELSKDQDLPPLWLRQLNFQFQAKLEALTTPQNPFLAHFRTPVAPELLSLRQQPGLRREGVVDLTAQIDLPSLKPQWAAGITESIASMGRYEDEKAKKPYPSGFTDVNDSRWAPSRQFLLDAHRDPVFVNGQPVSNAEELLARLPDRRTAAQLSRVLHQGLGGAFIESAPPGARELVFGAYVARELISLNTASVIRRPSVVSLGDGAYRVSYEFGNRVNQIPKEVSPDAPALTDMINVVSFTIRTGDEPTIEDVLVDMLLLGK